MDTQCVAYARATAAFCAVTSQCDWAPHGHVRIRGFSRAGLFRPAKTALISTLYVSRLGAWLPDEGEETQCVRGAALSYGPPHPHLFKSAMLEVRGSNDYSLCTWAGWLLDGCHPALNFSRLGAWVRSAICSYRKSAFRVGGRPAHFRHLRGAEAEENSVFRGPIFGRGLQQNAAR